MPRAKKKPVVKRSKARDKEFLALLETGIGPTKAAPKVGYSVSAAYKHRNEDEVFAKLWDEAHEVGVQVAIGVMEKEADRRSTTGVLEPVYQKGRLVGRVRKYSDTLLMFRMKRLDPAYKERVDMNHSGQIDNPSAANAVVNLVLSDGDKPQSTPATK